MSLKKVFEKGWKYSFGSSRSSLSCDHFLIHEKFLTMNTIKTFSRFLTGLKSKWYVCLCDN